MYVSWQLNDALPGRRGHSFEKKTPITYILAKQLAGLLQSF